MTTFLTRTSTHLGVDRIFTSVTATALYNNLFAAFQGDATAISAGIQVLTAAIGDLQVTEGKIAAGAVTEGKLGNSAVAQAKLKSTTASGSVQEASGTTDVSYTLTGGNYSWWTGSADTSSGAGFAFSSGNVAAGVIGLRNLNAAGAFFFVDERYITASPPYNLGHGDIPLFVMALVAGDGTLRGISVAPDPTWAYHGPTNIAPEFYDETGRPFRRYREVEGVPIAQAVKDLATLQKMLAGQIEVQTVTREITQEVKNADMNLFPHPWVGNNMTGLTAVMLDPLSPLVDRLSLISSEAGAHEVRGIIEKGYLNLGNVRLSMNAPAGVMPVEANWRAS
jgi:hypothetical protein